MRDRGPMPPLLWLYLGLSPLFAIVARPILQRRLAQGKEDPDRWAEKLGQPSAPRPPGPLIWLHAVGLGEVLALRALIAALSKVRPDLSFLVTSTARSSAQVLAGNLPDRTIHQFLPIDAPTFRRAFLDHWTPNLVIWAEQDIWPGLVLDVARRKLPQILVNARLDAKGRRAKPWAKRVYAALFSRFSGLWAQDRRTADWLDSLGLSGPVPVMGSLKPAAPPLAFDPVAYDQLRQALAGRRVWMVGPSHPEDEAVALRAHIALHQTDPTALLILAPRLPARGGLILQSLGGFIGQRRTVDTLPHADTTVFIADTFGEMGLWYRLASHALIGGSFGPVQGHNPWEAAQLGCAILHGPMTDNFADDYAALDAAGGSVVVRDSAALVGALLDTNTGMRSTAQGLADAAKVRVEVLATDVLRLLNA